MPSYTELPDNRGGSKNDTGTITDARIFRVIMDSATDRGIAVLNYVVGTIGIDIGSGHPEEALLTCSNISYKHNEGSKIWLVTCTYSTRQADPDDSESDPTTPDARKSWSTVKEEEILENDENGDAVVNAANQPFVEPPVTRTRSRIRWTFTRHESTTDAAFDTVMETYVDTVNSTTFIGKTAGTVYCEDITAERVYKNGTEYKLATYVFLHDPDGFDATPMNAGYLELNDAGDLVKIMDSNEEPVTSPYPLDADGKKIPHADLPGDINFLTFVRYPSANHTALGLV